MARSSAADPVLVARGFHALSDTTRVEVVELLRGGELCVCELMNALDAAQSRLSFHLKVLKEAGIVTDRRDGRWVYYTLDHNVLGELQEFLSVLRTVKHGIPRANACCD